jgi:hypothetical protein
MIFSATTTQRFNMYHYVTINAVMRDCNSIEDAIKKCGILLPQYPDENTVHMESWAISEIYETATGKTYIETQEC